MKFCRSTARCLAALLFVCGLAAAPAGAQTVTGEIRGTVRDSSGGVLPGVTVTVTNTQTGLARTDTTSEHRAPTSFRACRSAPTPSRAELTGLSQGGANRLRSSRRTAASRPTSRWRSAR